MTRPPSVGRRAVATALILTSMFAMPALLAAPAHANNYGESYGWQFKTSADRANQTFVLDLMEKRRSGYYQAPSYTTNIDRQYNCGVTANAIGNEGSQTAIANSPSVSGPTALATGNDADTVLNGGGRQGGNRTASWQSNSGMVSAGVTGSAGASVSGSPTQGLNSTQTNRGSQYANVSGASACSFGGAR